jgi:hypothetical protein
VPHRSDWLRSSEGASLLSLGMVSLTALLLEQLQKNTKSSKRNAMAKELIFKLFISMFYLISNLSNFV